MRDRIRHLVRRLASLRAPRDASMFDPGLATACLELSDLAYTALPEHDFNPHHDLQTIEDRGALDAFRGGAFGGPDLGGIEHFIVDGYFVKAVGIRINDILLVAVRGTKGAKDLLTDANAFTTCVSWRTCYDPDPQRRMVHRGFLELASQIHLVIERHLANMCRPGDRIVLTGHSLGGALGCLFAAQFNHLGLSPGAWPRQQMSAEQRQRLDAHCVSSIYSFGAPMLCAETFAAPFDFTHHRFVADGDPVPFICRPGKGSIMTSTPWFYRRAS